VYVSSVIHLSVLQCVAVCCSVLQCVSMCCSNTAVIYLTFSIIRYLNFGPQAHQICLDWKCVSFVCLFCFV